MLQVVFTTVSRPLHRALKRAGWMFAALALAPLVAYAALIALNWRDRPPSAAAVRLSNASLAHPSIEAAQNAYVFMMGFAVAPHEDPLAAGIVRTAWSDDFVAGATTSPDPIRPELDIAGLRSAEVRELARLCRVANTYCASALANDAATLRSWLEAEQWFLSRYETLLAHAAWREPAPLDLRTPFPSYATVLEAQQVLHMRAWHLAHNGQIDVLRDLLARDIRFWRLTLRSADLLMTKMIAVAALQHHFEFGNLALRELPAEAIRDGIPAEWLVEFSATERSLLNCLAGEWKYLDNLVREAKGSDDGAITQGAQSLLTPRVLWRALNPLLQPQDSSNETADRFVMLATELDVPYAQFIAALGRVRARVRKDSSSIGVSAYNATGALLAYNSPADYTAYAVRVADIEGVRRAAVLTAGLRADRVAESEVGRYVVNSSIRDPYDSKPFEWDARAHAVVFTGLEGGDQGRHAFLY